MTDKKLSVLMVGPARDAQGGITSVVNGYFDAGLQNRCHLNYVGTTSNAGYAAKALAAWKALRRFDHLLPTADIIHIHLGSGVSMARKQLFLNRAKRYGKPVIIHDHRPLTSDFSGQGTSFLKRNRQFFEQADAVIVLSEGERAFYLREHLCQPANIAVIHNAVQIPEASYFSFSSKRVVVLAEMTPRKGQDVLIRAIPSIIRRVPAAVFVFAGNGDVTPYTRLAEKLGVTEHCRFLGWVSGNRKERVLSNASVYVQASRDEGMAMGLLEAMARGLPVVATDVGATARVVHDGREGFLIPPDDPDALAEHVSCLLEKQDMAANMSWAAKSLIQHQFNINTGLDRLMALYNQVAPD